MNLNLKALLLAIGVVTVTGITVNVLTPLAGVSAADLAAAADGGCVRKDVKIQLGPDICPDGGYCRKRLDVARCPDGDGGFSVIIPRKYAAAVIAADFISAPSASTLPQDGEADEAWDCACPRDSTCRYLDGGSAYPNGQNRLPAGTFTGGGCFPMPCTLVSGKPYWPVECPP